MKTADVHSQLKTYRKKRHFDITPEPEGDIDAREKTRAAEAHLFVIQKHAARRLHYDFRLELGGTLKSWAVPKGPSLDPSIKRMAVHVEDHPLSYAEFEGTIPAGNYGAGTVIVWDIGTWLPEDDPQAGYEKGHLRFELRGKKLRGHWHLVRTHGRSGDKESWLLFKHADGEARPAAQYDIVEAEPDSVLQGTVKNARAAARKNAEGSAVAKKNAVGKDTSEKKAAKKLVRTSAEAILDIGARAPQPLMLAPQLATLVDAPPRDSGWIYEVKFDGYRILTRIDKRDGVRLFTRNGNDWTPRLKSLARALERWRLEDAWLDGEIIVLDTNGVSNFQKLQNAFEMHQTTQILYMLFDILYYRDRDLRQVPLHQRRQLLQALMNEPQELIKESRELTKESRELMKDPKEPMRSRENVLLRFSDHIDARLDDLLEAACRMQVEGLIGKRANSVYTSGRTRDWIKLKCMQRQEFVIGGYTDASNDNVRAIGALLLGVHDAQGNLRYVGKVGTGFTQQSAIELRQKLEPLHAAKSPFTETIRQPHVHWVKPALLAEIAFGAWTDDGHIRHSSFQGLRSDKSPAAITRETPVHIEDAEMPSADSEKPQRKAKRNSGARNATAAKAARRPRAGEAEVAGVAISHPDRVIDKSSGITKLELVRYYERVAPQLLAHLKDRPVSLVRGPDGVGGEVFFQKHRGSLHIPELTELDPALMPNHPPLIAVESLAALIHCAQMNVVEFHTWNARLAHSEQPDRMVFDLDPGEGIVWPQIVEAAQLMKTVLDELTLKSFLKTSGGKGLHVVVPLAPRESWQAVRDFSEDLVRHMAGLLPQLFVATSGPKNRVGRIFIDYLRNNRGSTTAAAFSARLRPGLGVSVPMAWEELRELESSAQWRVDNIDEAVAAERARCWKDYARVRQTLTRARKILDGAR